MPRTRSPGRRAIALAAACVLAVAARAQQDAAPSFPATERWLASDQGAGAERDAAVVELLARPEAGFAWFGAELHREASRERRAGLTSLLPHASIEFLRRERLRGMRYAGQYAVLQPLQPEIGEFLFGLLLDTPAWYPHTHRVRLVPALRDLQPKSPGDPRIGRVIRLVENEAIEPEGLRAALAGMLWQWGVTEYAQARLDALREQSAEGDAEDRVRVMLDLAEYAYELREYKTAAGTYRSVQAMARAAQVPLRPIDCYQSACTHTLAGDLEHAVAALEQCAALQVAPGTDESLRLQRSLFENDPELRALRADPRFATILARAFPSPAEPETPPRGP